jgi:hypothetical protein
MVRVLSLPYCAVVVWAILEWLFPSSGKPYGDPHTWPHLLIATTMAGISAFFAAKSLFVGIWLLEDGVVVRSWFRAWRLPRDQAACRAVGYDGLLMRGGPSGYWSMLEFTKEDGKIWAARATIARRRKSLRQAASVNVWLGAPVATPPGFPPRHLRAAQEKHPDAD